MTELEQLQDDMRNLINLIDRYGGSNSKIVDIQSEILLKFKKLTTLDSSEEIKLPQEKLSKNPVLWSIALADEVTGEAETTLGGMPLFKSKSETELYIKRCGFSGWYPIQLTVYTGQNNE